jgi:hypothetical protein
VGPFKKSSFAASVDLTSASTVWKILAQLCLWSSLTPNPLFLGQMHFKDLFPELAAKLPGIFYLLF